MTIVLLSVLALVVEFPWKVSEEDPIARARKIELRKEGRCGDEKQMGRNGQVIDQDSPVCRGHDPVLR